jgi:hypothetical protein
MHVYIYKGKEEVLNFDAENWMSAVTAARSSMFALGADRFEIFKWSGEVYHEKASDHIPR